MKTKKPYPGKPFIKFHDLRSPSMIKSLDIRREDKIIEELVKEFKNRYNQLTDNKI